MLTIGTIVDADRVEGLAADGASICFLSPGADAGVVDDVLAAVEGGDDVEIVVVLGDGISDGSRQGCVVRGGGAVDDGRGAR